LRVCLIIENDCRIFGKNRFLKKPHSQQIKYCPPPADADRSFLIDHVRVKPIHQIKFHQQETFELSYITLGSGTRIIGNTVEPFAEGEIIFIPPDIPHCWLFDDFNVSADGNIENICIFFSPKLLDDIFAGFPELSTYAANIRKMKDAIMFTGEPHKKLQHLMKATRDESQVEQFASLIRILAVVAGAEDTTIAGKAIAEDRASRRLQLAHTYVINNFQKNIVLDDAAKFVGMDKSSFCTFFKKTTGKSFFTFIAEYRVESASQMLEKTSMPVSEICHTAGFNDVPYFNRMFKKIKSVTPTKFRDSQKLAKDRPA
jgi:AraC-like DNA-binding protein/mannose-6-phosphate isomerase-like protein (cupin superfamily)